MMATMDSAAAARCGACGSGKIVVGIRMGLNAEPGGFGLKYQTVIFLIGTEPLLADLCEACGTVARMYVREVGRKWIHQK